MNKILYSDKCYTVDGDECRFPFKYQGTWHNNCIDSGLKHQWCATTVNRYGKKITHGKCRNDCPKGNKYNVKNIFGILHFSPDST